jgi:hypothetical protein
MLDNLSTLALDSTTKTPVFTAAFFADQISLPQHFRFDTLK